MNNNNRQNENENEELPNTMTNSKFIQNMIMGQANDYILQRGQKRKIEEQNATIQELKKKLTKLETNLNHTLEINKKLQGINHNDKKHHDIVIKNVTIQHEKDKKEWQSEIQELLKTNQRLNTVVKKSHQYMTQLKGAHDFTKFGQDHESYYSPRDIIILQTEYHKENGCFLNADKNGYYSTDPSHYSLTELALLHATYLKHSHKLWCPSIIHESATEYKRLITTTLSNVDNNDNDRDRHRDRNRDRDRHRDRNRDRDRHRDRNRDRDRHRGRNRDRNRHRDRNRSRDRDRDRNRDRHRNSTHTSYMEKSQPTKWNDNSSENSMRFFNSVDYNMNNDSKTNSSSTMVNTLKTTSKLKNNNFD